MSNHPSTGRDERPRFEVCSIEGYDDGARLPTIVVWIADRDYGFREVAWFRPSRSLSHVTCRQRAERRCAELNTEHDAWMLEAVPVCL